MSKRSRKSKRRLNSLLWMVVLTGMLLLFSTYAWFSANRVVSIDGIHTKVTAAEGLQISLDGLNWTSSIDNLETELTGLGKSINNYTWPAELRPVSTDGHAVDSDMVMYYGEVSADGSYLLSPDQNTADFVAFDLYFKNSSSNDEDTLQLNLGTKLEVTDEDLREVTGLENSARVAILFYSDNPVDLSTEQNTILGLTTKTPTAVIWEPNYNKHIAEVVANDKRIENTSSIFTTLTLGGITTSKLADGVTDAITNINVLTAAEDTAGNLVATQTLTTDGKLTANVDLTDTNGVTVTLPGNKIVKARVYIYLEGQDPDCIDTASTGKALDFYLSFSKPAATTSSSGSSDEGTTE